MFEIEEAIDRLIAGPQRKSRVMSAQEKRVTAYHEIGHALVAHMLKRSDPGLQGHHPAARSDGRLYPLAAA